MRKATPLLLFVAVLSLPVRGAEKLVIESPASGQKFSSGHVVVVVKVDPSIRRVRAEVTVPAAKKESSQVEEAASAAEAVTVFVLGPVELRRGVDRWSPDVGLAKGDNTIKVCDADDEKTSASVQVTADEDEITYDTRNDFQSTFYAGASIDSFASNETKQYIGYTAADSGPKTGYAAGVDFAYRFFKHNTESRFPAQLWVFGETIHGQRSAEVDCSQSQGNGSNALPVCQDLNPATAPETFLAILRNSTSLGGNAGARLEFLKLNKNPNYSANIYVKSQFGFTTVQNSGGDVLDDHLKFALGTIMTNGRFSGSYLDAGWGRTDLFAVHPGRRFKVDGYVQWEVRVSEHVRMYPFFQMTVDSDFGRGADDFRTYYGINMDLVSLSQLFGQKGSDKKAAQTQESQTSTREPESKK